MATDADERLWGLNVASRGTLAKASSRTIGCLKYTLTPGDRPSIMENGCGAMGCLATAFAYGW